MKLSTVVFGTLAVFATASVVRSPQPDPEPQGLQSLQEMITFLSEFPGLHDIQQIRRALKKDKTWKADYSEKSKKKVTFSNFGEKLCAVAQKGFKKNEKAWGKYCKATFASPCPGGVNVLSGMEEGYIDKLRKYIGDGN